jgi:hypothetical protein
MRWLLLLFRGETVAGCAKDESGNVPAAATQAPPHKRPRRLQSVELDDVSFSIGASEARLWGCD